MSSSSSPSSENESFFQSIRQLWIPTSKAKLQQAETAILNTMTCPYIQEKVLIDDVDLNGKIISPKNQDKVNEDDNDNRIYINTVTLGSKSPIKEPDRHLLLIHGFGAGVGMWTLNADDLSKRFDGVTHMIDLLGHGTSSRPEFKAKTTQEAEDFFVDSIEKWRIKQNINKLILCGHSFGGYMSSVYALKYPDRVQSLILASPVGVPPRPATDTRFARASFAQRSLYKTFSFLWGQGYTPQSIVRALGPWGRGRVEGYVNNRFMSSDSDANHNNDSDSIYLNKPLTSDYLYHVSAAPGSGEYALNLILAPGAWAHNPLHNRLIHLAPHIPVHFIYGESDWMDPRAGLRAVEALREKGHSKTSIALIQGAGHQVSIDQPKKFTQQLIDAINMF